MGRQRQLETPTQKLTYKCGNYLKKKKKKKTFYGSFCKIGKSETGPTNLTYHFFLLEKMENIFEMTSENYSLDPLKILYFTRNLVTGLLTFISPVSWLMCSPAGHKTY
jgi:hypothetical protein